MTEKLYETNSHLSNHKAVVISCTENKVGYDLVLDKTAFFPEGGGQPSDVGTIDNAVMSDANIKDGIVHHTVDRYFEAGSTVECNIDMNVRFPRMQCHTGEHIVSGIIHRLYGYNNVGFHMGSKDITLDIDGELSSDELSKVEWLANEAVVKNVPIKILYPTDTDGEKYDYRSKLEITDGLRLVEIEGYDLCACCAPHVEMTGEIGIIKLLEHIRYKGGTRIHMLCGFKALEDYRTKFAELSSISEMLSAKKDECADAVRHLRDSLGDIEYKSRNIIKAALLAEAERAVQTDGNLLFIEPTELASGLRDLVTAALPKCGGICAAFAGTDGNYSFVMTSSSVDLRAATPEILSFLSAKGGGSSSMIQGTAKTDKNTIREYFSK